MYKASTTRYILKRKSDGAYYNPTTRPSWRNRPQEAKLYVNRGHPRLAFSTYVHFSRFRDTKARKIERARIFDESYIILSVEVTLAF